MTKGIAQDYTGQIAREIRDIRYAKYRREYASIAPLLNSVLPSNYQTMQRSPVSDFAMGKVNIENYQDEMEALIELINEEQKLILHSKFSRDTSKMDAYFEYMRELIDEKGVDPNFACSSASQLHGSRPIHMSALAGSSQMIEYLHAKNVDLTACEGRGQNFLHCALGSYHPVPIFRALEIIDGLNKEEQEQILAQKDQKGDDPLAFCVVFPHYNNFILEWLLFCGEFDQESRDRAILVATIANNGEAIKTIKNYEVLRYGKSDFVDLGLVIDFTKMHKMYEISSNQDVLDHFKSDNEFFDNAGSKYYKRFKANFQAAEQEKRDQFLPYIFRISTTLIGQHYSANIGIEFSKSLIGKITSVAHEIMGSCNIEEEIEREFSHDSLNYALIHLAAYANRPDVITSTIAKFSRNQEEYLNSHNIYKNAPLHFAIYGHCLDAVDRLLALDANPVLMNSNGDNAFMHAVKRQHDDIASLLLKHDPTIIQNKNPLTNKTVLHYLAQRKITSKEVELKQSEGSNDLVDAILESKAIENLLDQCDNLGNSALHYAVLNKTENLANELIKHGCSKTIVNKDNKTPLDFQEAQNMYLLPSKQEKQEEFSRIMRYSKSVLDSPKSKVVIKDSYKLYELYHEFSSYKHDHNKGWSPLHIAARCGHQEVVHNFIKDGNDVNALTDDKKYSVLDCAIFSQNQALITELIHHPRLTIDTMKQAIYHCAKDYVKNLSAITSSPHVIQRFSVLDQQEIQDFINKAPNIKNQQVKRLLNEFKTEIICVKTQDQEYAKTQRALMAQEDIRRIQQAAQAQRQRDERMAMEQEDTAMQVLVQEECEQKDRQMQEMLLMHDEDNRAIKLNVIQPMLEDMKNVVQYRMDEIQREEEQNGSIIPNHGQEQQEFIKDMNHFLILCDNRNMKETISHIPYALEDSMACFIRDGYTLSLRGSAMNRAKGTRIPADLDIKISGDLAEKNPEEIYKLFHDHFGAKPSQLKFYTKNGHIDTIQYKDEQRKLDVTLYQKGSRSSSHWIDSIEQEVSVTLSNKGKLIYTPGLVQGCYDDVRSMNRAMIPALKAKKTVLFNSAAKDVCLISAFRFSANPQYYELNHRLMSKGADFVGALTAYPIPQSSVTASILEDLQRRYPQCHNHRDETLYQATQDYITKFMTSHKMDDAFKIGFLQNLAFFMQDPRNMAKDAQLFPVGHNPIYNAMSDMMYQLTPSVIMTPRLEVPVATKTSQRGSYTGMP